MTKYLLYIRELIKRRNDLKGVKRTAKSEVELREIKGGLRNIV